MEKSISLILVCFFAIQLSAQEQLCVFNIKGMAFAQFKSKKEPLRKGDLLSDQINIWLLAPAEITFIDAEGQTFKINKVGDYTIKDIIEKAKIKNQKSLTSKYFKLIWEELTQKENNKTIIGGVFRGDLLMQFPKDSMSLASNKLKFKWKKTEDISTYYIFIKNLTTDKFFKASTNGNEMQLYKNQDIFTEGDVFEWTVSTEEFPNLKNLPFNTFKLISKNEYQKWLETQSDLVSDLKKLGMTENEITKSLCETYGICK